MSTIKDREAALNAEVRQQKRRLTYTLVQSGLSEEQAHALTTVAWNISDKAMLEAVKETVELFRGAGVARIVTDILVLGIQLAIANTAAVMVSAMANNGHGHRGISAEIIDKTVKVATEVGENLGNAAFRQHLLQHDREDALFERAKKGIDLTPKSKTDDVLN